ncbi:hypothetical protein Q7P37_007744 [Cladosporium fusiforme]
MQSSSYELLTVSEESRAAEERTTALGVPTTKPRLRKRDAMVILTSFSCCAFAILAVQNQYLAWHLGSQYQLIVVGFSLSIMNLCLEYSLPFLLVLLEARFGSSTLQNYDAILQKTFLGPQMNFLWRSILLLSMMLPLGLSAAYKLFGGGNSTLPVQYDGPVYYGLYPPLGLEKVGQSTGVSLMSNLSLPFIQNTTALELLEAGSAFPVTPGAYGLNNMLISEHASAALDLPSPEFVSGVRTRLKAGEVWQVEAGVLATVTRQNETVQKHHDVNSEDSAAFWDPYFAKVDTPKVGFLFNEFEIWMLNNQKENDQTWLFISIQPGPSDNEVFKSKARMFSTWREPCLGIWNITTTTMRLVGGSCNAESAAGELDDSLQVIFTNNNLGLDVFFMPTLIEYLGPFATSRKGSVWELPTMTSTIASMMYSRVTVLNGPLPAGNEGAAGRSYAPRSKQTITSTRPSLSRSPWLFVIICVQPVLLSLSMIGTWLLYSVPVDRSFGLISILAGIDRISLQRLDGASFSAKLRSEVRLSIAVQEPTGGHSKIRYTVDGQERRAWGKVDAERLYG